MNALFYNHTGRASGAEKVLLLALEHLDRTVVHSRVVCPPGDLSRSVEALDIPVGYIGELNARLTLWPHKLAWYAVSLFRTVLGLRGEVKRADVDVIHANSPRSGIAALFATAGMRQPVVWHVHDEFNSHPITSLIRYLVGSSSRCTVIAVSEATAKSFAGDSAKLKERIQVIHNAVDVDGIEKKKATRSIRQELGLGSDDFLFGIVGQITPRKGQLELVKAFCAIASDMPAARLLVIGSPMFEHDNTYHEEVLRQADPLILQKRIYFLGHRTDAVDIIKQLDTLIINSKSEAFVMVGIEAMACGTAVIATNVGGTREMIEDGQNGILVPAEDKPALTGALTKIYADKNLRELFVSRSREKVKMEFNVSQFAKSFQNVLLTAGSARADNAPILDRPLDPINNR